MEKIINDSAHGHIALPPLCVKIMDTQEFQRLRHLKQLGWVYWVYPGASHNRFEHCLGVSHLAGLVADNLNKNRCKDDPEITKDEKLCLQVAGLCHDLGHGPFSHTWEKFLRKAGDREWKHEDMSIRLFDLIIRNEEVHREFISALHNREDAERYIQMIKDFIKGETPEHETKAFLYEIICNNINGIDVDKWDYLLRDFKYLNIGTTFDLHRLMYCQRVMKDDADGKYHICYREKAIPEIWQMYMMRRELHRKACYHPVTEMLEEMWLDALMFFDSSDYRFFGKKLSEVHEEAADYVYLTDEIFQELSRSGNEYSENGCDLLRKMKTRTMYKVWRKEKLKENDFLRGGQKFSDIVRLIEQKLQVSNINVYVTSMKMDKDYEDLRKKVITFNKHGIICKGDWSSYPLFPSSEDMQKHKEVIFYSKSQAPINGLSEVAQNVQINCVIDRILHELRLPETAQNFSINRVLRKRRRHDS